jgi:TPR repeat protein
LAKGEVLLADGKPVERFKVGIPLWWRGEKEVAYRLMCLSAQQGNHNAQRFMASGYWHGDPLFKADYFQDYKFLSLTPKEYRSGEPLFKSDYVQAYKWYSLGISAGAEYSRPRDALSTMMTPSQIDEAERLVAEWVPNPAECELETVERR